MIPSTVQFITAMKLRELQRQREHFRDSYRRLRQEVEAAADSMQRLRRLYEGLQAMKLSGQPLHPEVVNLEMALRELEAGTLAPDMLALWQGRLEHELSAGQVRSEFVYLFGALLEEWARAGSNNPVLREQSSREGQRLLAEALAPAEPNHHVAFFDSLLEGLEPVLTELSRQVKEIRADAGAMRSRLGGELGRIARDIYQTPRVRKEANDFVANPALLKELSDALTIFLAELPHWDWPAEGLRPRPQWTRNKWRLYLDLDLPTASLLEAVGSSWVFLWEESIGTGDPIEEQLVRLRKLQMLNAPDVLVQNQRRLVERARQMVFLSLSEEGSLWDTEGAAPAMDIEEMAPRSIREKRREQLTSLQRFRVGSGYEDDEYGNQTTTLQLIHAEIQLARAAFPEQPLHVVKIDLKDFYASIPHDVLMTVLAKVGVPEPDRHFFQRFLSPPLLAQPDARPVRMRRGVPMGLTLSGALAELLLRFLDRHVQRRARVRIVRLVDDICLLTPKADEAVAGWKAVEEFCAACGLQVNRAKSGAACLGGTIPDAVPPQSPSLGHAGAG
jgi:hypothetical protein